ncbi:ATP-binding protein [Eubacteriales bacterium OttesenSCG-928-N14]|nr:ATP-binding protein [Eubacteriales bacterium OttesenSCG-928-N14]
MKDISLHITDIVQNSITAGAHTITVEIRRNTQKGTLTIAVVDDGKGMSEELRKSVMDPFTTTRTTRNVGLGIPLFLASAERTGGSLQIESELGKGTKIVAVYHETHIDCPPLGDIAQMMELLIVTNADLDFIFICAVDDTAYELDTRVLRQILGQEVPLSTPEVGIWIKESLTEGISQTIGG